MINIFARQAPPPTSQHIMDAIQLDEEKAALVTEIADVSTGAALYSQHRGYRGRERGGSGRFGRQKTHRCTYCNMDNHTPEACGKRKRAQSGNSNSGGKDSSGGENAGGSDEKACYRCGIPGHIRPDCIHYKRAKETLNRVHKASTAQTRWVIDSGASHRLRDRCSLHTYIPSFTLLHQSTGLRWIYSNVWRRQMLHIIATITDYNHRSSCQ